MDPQRGELPANHAWLLVSKAERHDVIVNRTHLASLVQNRVAIVPLPVRSS